jgi:hypothetical protein
MARGKTVHLALSLVFYSSVTVFGQWSAANSGTTNNLNGGYLLDSGVGFVVGDAGTIVKTTDAGVTWSPLTSGTTNALRDVYFFDATQGVAVGEQGLIFRTTDGGAGWQSVSSGVTDTLGSVSFTGVNGISGGNSRRRHNFEYDGKVLQRRTNSDTDTIRNAIDANTARSPIAPVAASLCEEQAWDDCKRV